ncbi:hypothetical protein E2C01_001365 [Portunus trituberculatus]|uniref:Uncharacterized protein n=1 Tax=Portunus trituberculatus TaxID=210409 RepID=A0A5B7CMD3_PORTR|nr:hypothetical protein [Portunus trituberculatus]
MTDQLRFLLPPFQKKNIIIEKPNVDITQRKVDLLNSLQEKVIKMTAPASENFSCYTEKVSLSPSCHAPQLGQRHRPWRNMTHEELHINCLKISQKIELLALFQQRTRTRLDRHGLLKY